MIQCRGYAECVYRNHMLRWGFLLLFLVVDQCPWRQHKCIALNGRHLHRSELNWLCIWSQLFLVPALTLIHHYRWHWLDYLCATTALTAGWVWLVVMSAPHKWALMTAQTRDYLVWEGWHFEELLYKVVIACAGGKDWVIVCHNTWQTLHL